MYKLSTTMKIPWTSLILFYIFEFQILSKPQSMGWDSEGNTDHLSLKPYFIHIKTQENCSIYS